MNNFWYIGWFTNEMWGRRTCFFDRGWGRKHWGWVRREKFQDTKRNLTGLDPAGRGGGGGGLDNAGCRRFFFRILVSTFTLSCFFNRKINTQSTSFSLKTCAGGCWFQSLSESATLWLVVVFCVKTAQSEGNDQTTAAIFEMRWLIFYQLEITEHFYALTRWAFVVKHPIWPNADFYFASDKTVFIISPCRQFTCMFMHGSVLVVVLRCNSDPKGKTVCLALWNE